MCSARKFAWLWTTVAAFSVFAPAQAPPGTAVVYADVEASVDGTTVPYGVTTIRPDQTLKTGGRYTATMDVPPHSTVFTGPETKLKYVDRSHARLEDGSVAVKTWDWFAVYVRRCGEVAPRTSAVAPSNDSGWNSYEVSIQGDTAFVYARNNDAQVKLSNRSLDLHTNQVAVMRRISSRECRVFLYRGWDDPDLLAYKIAWGSMAATAATVPFWFDSRSGTVPVPPPVPPSGTPIIP